MGLLSPEYFEDRVDGQIVGQTLYVGGERLSDIVAVSGGFVIRYAIPALVPPGALIIPGLFVAERGGILRGLEAWEYLHKRFQVHPRADVIGQTPNGQPAQFLVRELDFGVPVRVFAYADPPGNQPLAELKALQATDAAFQSLPDLLKRYLPTCAP